MSITSYSELKSAIQSYGKRGDASSMLDTFIDLAESDIWDVLRIRDMEARATAVTSTSDRFIQLPDGFIAMRRLRIILSDGAHVDLDYTDPKNLCVIDRAGMPVEFTAGTQLEFNRTSDQEYTLEMKYWKEPTPLSTSNTTNAVLTEHPMIYLSGSLKHFFEWAQNENRAQYWEGVFNKHVARANRKSRQGRYGPVPTRRIAGGMVV